MSCKRYLDQLYEDARAYGAAAEHGSHRHHRHDPPPPPRAVFTGASATSKDNDSLGESIITTLPQGIYQPNQSQDLREHLPVTAQDAEKQGWAKVVDDTCVDDTCCIPSLGVLYAPKGGVSRDSPVSLYFTPAEQLAGLKMTVFDLEGDAAAAARAKGEVTSAAQGNLAEQGYYAPVKGMQGAHEMSVSFRGKEDVCSTKVLPKAVGDRVVINQHTIERSIPMKAGDAEANHFSPGSCALGMGQHWHTDLSTGSTMSWITGNTMPVTPMYYPPNDPEGKINGIYLHTPVCQYDHGTSWDNFPTAVGCVPAAIGCHNYCEGPHCTVKAKFPPPPSWKSPWHSPTANQYASMHIIFQEQEDWDTVTCPGGIIATCPGGTGAHQPQTE